MGEAFLSEVIGTGMLVLLGTGVVANVDPAEEQGVRRRLAAHQLRMGPRGLRGRVHRLQVGRTPQPSSDDRHLGRAGRDEFAPGIPVTAANGFLYVTAQMLGAAIGALLCFLAYKKHFDEDADGATKLAVFSTGPAIRSYGWNFITEVIGTFVLVFVILAFGETPAELGPLAVALLVVGIGASLGGPTGYAINPARDLGPRIAHALLPIRGKGSSDWAYSWVPIFGPLVGGVIAGLVAHAYIG